jgi:malonate transporter
MTAILQDIVAIFAVLALGYLAGRRNAFTQDQAEGLLHLVLTYALPAMLFVSIARSTRAELFSDGRMLALAAVVLVGWQAVAFVVARRGFGRDRREAGIASLATAAPTIGFLGTAVLVPSYGPPSVLSVAIVALVINLVMIPLTVFLIAPADSGPGAALVNAVRQPLVLAPLLAVLLVLAGVPVPTVVLEPLGLIAHANSGVAVFAAGLLLAANRPRIDREIAWNSLVKLVLVPGSMLAGALWIGLSGDRLEELVLLAALPTLFTSVVLAGRYRVYVEPASSTMIVTSLAFALAAPAWIALARAVGG